jgi:hypothetical protein
MKALVPYDEGQEAVQIVRGQRTQFGRLIRFLGKCGAMQGVMWQMKVIQSFWKLLTAGWDVL